MLRCYFRGGRLEENRPRRRGTNREEGNCEGRNSIDRDASLTSAVSPSEAEDSWKRGEGELSRILLSRERKRGGGGGYPFPSFEDSHASRTNRTKIIAKPWRGTMLACVYPAENFKSKAVTVKLRHGRSKRKPKLLSVKEKLADGKQPECNDTAPKLENEVSFPLFVTCPLHLFSLLPFCFSLPRACRFRFGKIAPLPIDPHLPQRYAFTSRRRKEI